MRTIKTSLLMIAMMTTLAACACRSGYVGPYGGVHPAHCVVW